MSIDNSYAISALTGSDGKGIAVQYSVDGSSSWHEVFSIGDLYMRQKVNGSSSWSEAMRIVGEKGEQGEQGIQGEQGADGTSITITSSSVKYQSSTSGTAVPTGTWSDTVPAVDKGKFLWTKTNVVYSDNTSTTAYSVSYEGTNGSKGDKGDKGDTGNTGPQGTRAIRYLGKYSSAPASYISGDWYLNTSTGYVQYYSSGWQNITSTTDYRLLDCIEDMISLLSTISTSAAGYTTLKTACDAYATALTAGTVLADKIFTKTITAENCAINGSLSINDSCFITDSLGKKNLYIGVPSDIGDTFKKLTTGVSNIGFGGIGFYNVTSGSANLCLGSGAGTFLTEGSNNIFFGLSAGSGTTTGSDNTYIGKSSGKSVSGSNNVCVGSMSGYHSDYNLGDNNILIGKGVTVSANRASNEINIGNAIKWANGVLSVKNSSGTLIGSNIVASSLGTSSSYVKFANGLIIQWGILAGEKPTSTTRTCTMPLAFSNTSYSIVISGMSTDTSSNTVSVQYSNAFHGSIYAKNTDCKSFKYRTANNGSYIAFGY